jgi:hypothetical protein
MNIPPSPERVRAIRLAESKARLTTTIAFFVMGLSVVVSLEPGAAIFASYARFVIPAGLGVGISILFLGRRWVKQPRTCPACHQSIPWNSERCPFCGS